MSAIFIQEYDFDPNLLQSTMKERLGARTGAIVSFTGYVRDYSDNISLKALFIEHYPDMCRHALETIVNRACKIWHLEEALVVHRIGNLYRNERIVFACTAGTHRKEAFLGCEYIMDMIKTNIPMWKCEIFEDGRRLWVKPNKIDYLSSDAWNIQNSF